MRPGSGLMVPKEEEEEEKEEEELCVCVCLVYIFEVLFWVPRDIAATWPGQVAAVVEK